MIVVEGESRAGAPKGSMTYDFTPSPSPLSPLPQPPGPYLSLKAHIPAFRPMAYASWLGFGPWGWYLGLGTGIQA